MSETKTFCPYFNQNECRSCSWLSMSPLDQVAFKEKRLHEALSLWSPFVLDPSRSSEIMAFRHRAKMTVTGTSQAPIIGILGSLTEDAQSSTKKKQRLSHGRELLSCPIHHPSLNQVIGAMPEFIREFNLIPYQIDTEKGELKGLILFVSGFSGEMYLRFVLRSKECVSRIKKLLPKLQAQFPKLVSVSANIQPIAHALLEGPDEIFVTERQSITHQFGSIQVELSPQGFAQTNEKAATALYQTAANWIGEAKPDRMLDLFCGHGAFSFAAHPQVKEILGIEINTRAVELANRSAQVAKLSHLTFKAKDASQVQKEVQEFGPDLILVNPPRRGLAKAVEFILTERPQHLIYSSCWVESLAQDLAHFSPHYELRRIQLFDFFLHTPHFETLVWLTHRKPQS